MTKFYRLPQLVSELGLVQPGSIEDDVRAHLGSGHTELANDLVLYDGKFVVDDPLLRACRERRTSALVLVWSGLVMADPRLALLVHEVLTDTTGKLREAEFNANVLQSHIRERFADKSTRKMATNVLSYFRDAGVVTPEVEGGTIVGIAQRNDMKFAVRDIVEYVDFRLEHRGMTPRGVRAGVDRALAVRANSWVDLTQSEFRAAAT